MTGEKWRTQGNHREFDLDRSMATLSVLCFRKEHAVDFGFKSGEHRETTGDLILIGVWQPCQCYALGRNVQWISGSKVVLNAAER